MISDKSVPVCSRPTLESRIMKSITSFEAGRHLPIMRYLPVTACARCAPVSTTEPPLIKNSKARACSGPISLQQTVPLLCRPGCSSHYPRSAGQACLFADQSRSRLRRFCQLDADGLLLNEVAPGISNDGSSMKMPLADSQDAKCLRVRRFEARDWIRARCMDCLRPTLPNTLVPGRGRPRIVA